MLEKGSVVGHTLVERPGILGQAQRRVRTADLLGQVIRVIGRMRNRHRRVLGIDADRRDVEREVLPHLRNHEPAATANLDARRGVKLELHPVTEHMRRELELELADRQMRLVVVRVALDTQRNLERRAVLEERVLRPLQRGLDNAVSVLELDSDTAFLNLFIGLACREQQERALGAEQVGHAHRRQLGAVELVRREGDRHPQHRAPDVVIAEDAPERLGFSQLPDIGLLGGNPVLADVERPLDAADMRRREQRQIRAPVAVQKIENVMPRRVGARCERRPGDGRQGGIGRTQPPVATLIPEFLQVRQQALFEILLRELGVLAVETDDDEPVDPGLGLVAELDRANTHADRPYQQRGNRQQHGREDD